MGIGDIRRDYDTGALGRDALQADPLAQFQQWFGQAGAGRGAGGRFRRIAIAAYKLLQAIAGREPVDVNAMVLATADPTGRPSARTVLLKGVEARGLIFFTNYDSRKGRELTANPHASLVFYWSDLERQVCISGTVTKLPREESEAYFRSRPKGSRIAAWASDQSSVVASRRVLEEKWQQMAARFPGDDVPLPPHWGGYVLAPERMEFWQGRQDRLHDRFCYTRQPDGSWRLERLAP